MRNIATIAITITLFVSPILAFAQADPHTNITPIEYQVENNIDAFTTYVQSGDFSKEQLREAIGDLEAVLDFYLRTLE